VYTPPPRTELRAATRWRRVGSLGFESRPIIPASAHNLQSTPVLIRAVASRICPVSATTSTVAPSNTPVSRNRRKAAPSTAQGTQRPDRGPPVFLFLPRFPSFRFMSGNLLRSAGSPIPSSTAVWLDGGGTAHEARKKSTAQRILSGCLWLIKRPNRQPIHLRCSRQPCATPLPWWKLAGRRSVRH